MKNTNFKKDQQTSKDTKKSTNLLFVCLGNICRSPMAEAMANKIIKEKHLEHKIKVDSAALSTEEENNTPHPEGQKVMQEHNLDFSHIKSRPINKKDFEWADYIIGMSNDNIAELKYLAPPKDQHKIHLCMDIVPNKKGENIVDPWYTHRFDKTYKSLSQAIPKWINKINSNQ